MSLSYLEAPRHKNAIVGRSSTGKAQRPKSKKSSRADRKKRQDERLAAIGSHLCSAGNNEAASSAEYGHAYELDIEEEGGNTASKEPVNDYEARDGL